MYDKPYIHTTSRAELPVRSRLGSRPRRVATRTAVLQTTERADRTAGAPGAYALAEILRVPENLDGGRDHRGWANLHCNVQRHPNWTRPGPARPDAKSSARHAAQTVVQTARSLIAVPRVWGAGAHGPRHGPRVIKWALAIAEGGRNNRLHCRLQFPDNVSEHATALLRMVSKRPFGRRSLQ